MVSHVPQRRAAWLLSWRVWPYTFSQSGLPLHFFFCRALALRFFLSAAWPSTSFLAGPGPVLLFLPGLALRFFFYPACALLFLQGLALHFFSCRAWPCAGPALLFLPGLGQHFFSWPCTSVPAGLGPDFFIKCNEETFILMQERNVRRPEKEPCGSQHHTLQITVFEPRTIMMPKSMPLPGIS